MADLAASATIWQTPPNNIVWHLSGSATWQTWWNITKPIVHNILHCSQRTKPQPLVTCWKEFGCVVFEMKADRQTSRHTCWSPTSCVFCCSKYLSQWVARRKAFPSEIYFVALLFSPRVNWKKRSNVCCSDYATWFFPTLLSNRLKNVEFSAWFLISNA